MTLRDSGSFEAADHGRGGPDPACAAHPIGDLVGDGTIDVRDALLLFDRIGSGGWNGFELYYLATEGLDDPAGQIDSVTADETVGYSFGTRLGAHLRQNAGFAT